MKYVKVWAVIALVAVAAGASAAPGRAVMPGAPATRAGGVEGPGYEPSRDVEVTWREAPVAIDEPYACEHPETVGLQAVHAADREVLRRHDAQIKDIREDVSDHEQRLDKLENPAQSSGRDNDSPAPTAAQGVTDVSAGAIVAIAVGGVLVVAFMTLVVVALFRRNGGNAVPFVGAFVAALNRMGGRFSGTAMSAEGDMVTVTGDIDPNAPPAAQPAQPAPAQQPAPAPAAQPAAQPAPAPPAAPAPQPAQGPGVAAIAAARAGLQRANLNPNLATSLYVAGILEATGVDLNNPGAVDGVIAAEQAAGNI